MAFPDPCHVCGEPGQLIGSDSEARPTYRCRTSVCNVIEFDHWSTLIREDLDPPPVWVRPRRSARASGKATPA